jgi:DNA-binding IclR family transcriptional regulator
VASLRAGSTVRTGTGDIQVVDRCAQVLRLFSSKQRSLRVADVAVELKLQRSTVHRYLASLTKAGFLERDSEGLYRLGPLLVQLGTIALRGLRVLEIADPYAQTLADAAGETVVIAVWGGLGPVVARVHEAVDRLVNISVRIGSALPIEAAQSQVFLAFLDDSAVEQRLLSRLPDIRRREIRDQVDAVRRDGFIVSSEVVQGVRALAAPIFEGSGAICATVAVIGTVSGISDPPPHGLVTAILQLAEQLSRELGYSGRLPFEDLITSRKLIS